MRDLAHDTAQLKLALAAWIDLDEPQWQTVLDLFRPKTTPSRTRLAHPGDQLHEMAFVTRGLLRYYYIDHNGSESNKAFVSEKMFAGPLVPATLNMPIYYGIEALEHTELLVVRFDQLQQLYDSNPIFERLGRKFAEMLLIRKELRTRSLLMQSATERYHTFATEFPDLLERVPQYHIASYLGVAEASLSRLKRGAASINL